MAREEVDTSDRRARAALDPQADSFLRAAALAGNRGRVMLTTRLFPAALDNLPGIAHRPLTGLAEDDARAFFAAEGVPCSHAQAAAILEHCGNHPLTLQLLAGWVKARPNASLGDIHWPKVVGELKGRQHHHVLEAAFAALDPTDRQDLGRLAALRGSVPLATARAMSLDPDGLDERLARLAQRGLIALRPRRGDLDMHPIVRQYAYEVVLSTPAERLQAHKRARDCFKAMPAPKTVECLADLEPVVELCRHTLAAGDRDGAYALFRSRLRDHLLLRFAGHRQARELLEPLFARGLAAPPALAGLSVQGSACTSLGHCFSRSGQPGAARALYHQALALHQKATDKNNQAVAWSNIGVTARGLGHLAEADEAGRTALAMTAPSDTFQLAVCNEFLADITLCRGASATAVLDAAAVHWHTAAPTFPYTPDTDRLRAYAALFAGDVTTARRHAVLFAERAARDDLAPVKLDSLTTTATIAAEAAWADGTAPAAALDTAHQAVRDARAGGFVQFEIAALVPLALLLWRHGRRDEARRTAAEAADLAAACEYRLHHADSRFALARLHGEAGERDMAVEHALAARALARCDGPPDFTYRWTWDRSGALLRSLGVEPPP